MQPKLICEVCKENEALGVCQAIAPVPFSLAHCQRCLELGLSPIGLWVATVCGSSFENISENYKQLIYTSLFALGGDLEEFKKDCEKATQEYITAMNNIVERRLSKRGNPSE